MLANDGGVLVLGVCLANVACPAAVKYSAVVEKGPAEPRPSMAAVASLPMTGSPFASMPHIDPILEPVS